MLQEGKYVCSITIGGRMKEQGNKLWVNFNFTTRIVHTLGYPWTTKKKTSSFKQITNHTFAKSRLSFFVVNANESRSLETFNFINNKNITKSQLMQVCFNMKLKGDAPFIAEDIKFTRKKECSNLEQYYSFVSRDSNTAKRCIRLTDCYNKLM